jgi:hypothetical protein
VEFKRDADALTAMMMAMATQAATGLPLVPSHREPWSRSPFLESCSEEIILLSAPH